MHRLATHEIPSTITPGTRLSVATIPATQFRLSIQWDDSDGTPFLSIPTATPPGDYVVRLTDSSTGLSVSSFDVSVAEPPRLAASSLPPVVLLNGFKLVCSASQPSSTFGLMPSLLSSEVLFFDNCVECSDDCSIDQLGDSFAQFLSRWRLADGTPVTQFDAVAYSMGGLILRSYLTGKVPELNEPTRALFFPPPLTKIRKAIFLATPHFGSGVANLGEGSQVTELQSGSAFTYSLATWNQGMDDLRGVDSIAIAGNAGTFGQSDGLIPITSASLSFVAEPARTRVLNYCHTDPLFLSINLPYGCSGDSIARITSASHPTYRIIDSFLHDTDEWRSIGQSAAQNQYLSSFGGLQVVSADSIENPRTDFSSVTFTPASGGSAVRLFAGQQGVYYSDFLPAGAGTLRFVAGASDIRVPYQVPAGGYRALLLKDPPVITRVLPAAGLVNTLSIAPGSFISIYGSGLADSTATATSLNFPTELGGTRAIVDGQPLGLLAVSPSQINAYLPQSLTGLVTLQINTAAGRHTQNLWMAPAVPAIFSQDRTGTGPGAITHALSAQLVTAANPAIAGEFVSIYVTGLGATNRVGSLDVTTIQPVVMFGNIAARVTFSGLAPGYVGLYQINAQVPAGVRGAAIPVTVQADGVTSNVVTLAVQ
jgi:uncharacterized protein (TIGR03437 family)